MHKWFFPQLAIVSGRESIQKPALYSRAGVGHSLIQLIEGVAVVNIEYDSVRKRYAMAAFTMVCVLLY